MLIKSYIPCFAFLLCCLVFYPTQDLYAQPSVEAEGFDYLLDNYKEQYHNFNKGPGAKKQTNNPDVPPSRYIYETPSSSALSHLFWGINMYKIEDDEAVDEFMRINECDIYKSFYGDELEWRSIRDATREFLRENKEDFPTRFEFSLPLKLKDYSEKRKAFEIQEEFKISSLRRFELFATDYRRAKKCTRDHMLFKGYPRGLVLEFSRPFSLTHVPVAQQKAYDYIKRKLADMKSYPERHQSKKLMYDLRGAYLILKVKVFTYGKLLGLNNLDIPMVQMMGVLEGYEIYEDINKEHLFYAQNYVTNQNKGKLDVILQPQYKVLREKSKAGGILR